MRVETSVKHLVSFLDSAKTGIFTYFYQNRLTDLVCPTTRLVTEDKYVGRHTTASVWPHGAGAGVSRFTLTSDALAFLIEN